MQLSFPKCGLTTATRIPPEQNLALPVASVVALRLCRDKPGAGGAAIATLQKAHELNSISV